MSPEVSPDPPGCIVNSLWRDWARRAEGLQARQAIFHLDLIGMSIIVTPQIQTIHCCTKPDKRRGLIAWRYGRGAPNWMSLLRVSSLCYRRTSRELERSEANELQLCDTELIQWGAFIFLRNLNFLSVFGLNEPFWWINKSRLLCTSTNNNFIVTTVRGKNWLRAAWYIHSA